jgi:hypothetical protein
METCGKVGQYSCFLLHHGRAFPFEAVIDTALPSQTVILGRKSVEGFYITPVKRQPSYDADISFTLRSIDQRIHALGKAVNLSRLLKPLNYSEELTRFVEKDGKYDPIFSYSLPEREALHEVEEQLDAIRDDLIPLGITHDMAKLLYEKTEEILVKRDLLLACISQDEKEIQRANQKLYGDIDPVLLRESQNRVKDIHPKLV